MQVAALEKINWIACEFYCWEGIKVHVSNESEKEIAFRLLICVLLLLLLGKEVC
jgi:hypothetical protein